ncbi:hypothetical protein [Flagellimonas sp.]|uniref:hypothetical protein n=1 Tax=Flagellimonas sp. TaxID=2058762 RepID=UPI003AB25F9D
MMTSRNNTRVIDHYLHGEPSFADKLLFEARLAVDPVLKSDFHFQKKTHRLLKMYHREKLREELEALHRELFNDPDKIRFRQSISQLFK